MSSDERTLRWSRDEAGPRVRLRSSQLVVLEGPSRGRRLPADGRKLHLGSDPENDLVLVDPSVSRRHATLEDTEAGFRLTDLRSTNGTWVSGVRIEGAYLDPGTVFRLGDTSLRFDHAQETWSIEPWPEESFYGMLGGSLPMRQLFSFLHRVAASELSVLVLGETGTGKEEAARALHAASPRASRPFVVFDGASTQADLMAATLFGHREGAFTGANRARPGCFQSAAGGTLFLDEVGEIPLDLQPMLLRALERREVQPLGSDQPVRVDVRIVAATHRDLETMVTSGTFRQDLYHRLSGVALVMPPLRERREDVPALAKRFLQTSSCAISPAALSDLARRDWPGNIRELRNVLQRAASLCADGIVDSHHLVTGSVKFGPGGPRMAVAPAAPRAPVSLEEQEKSSILEALDATRWNLTLAAQLLGISRQTLWRRLKSYGLRRPDDVQDPEPGAG